MGSPIAHSLSPAMHRAAYRELGLDGWTYDAHKVPAGGLRSFVDGLDERWRGLSVTMPLKREAAALAERRTDDVAFLGVANTLVRDSDSDSDADGDGWAALNTDIPGAVAALRRAGVDTLSSARILGGGATAASLTVAISRLGATEVRFAAREPRKVEGLARMAVELGLDAIIEPLADPMAQGTDVLLSTVPVAALAGREQEFVGSAGVVFDVVYDPYPSPMMTLAQATGRPVIGGLDLLAHQAVLQIFAMTGETVDADLLVHAADLALGERP